VVCANASGRSLRALEGPAQLHERRFLDLADALARQPVLAADVGQRALLVLLTVRDAEALADDGRLQRLEVVDGILELPQRGPAREELGRRPLGAIHVGEDLGQAALVVEISGLIQ
jgi:hypothetical protein